MNVYIHAQIKFYEIWNSKTKADGRPYKKNYYILFKMIYIFRLYFGKVYGYDWHEIWKSLEKENVF